MSDFKRFFHKGGGKSSPSARDCRILRCEYAQAETPQKDSHRTGNAVFRNLSLAFVLGVMMLFIVPGAMGAEEEDVLDELSLYELRNLETFMVTATKRKVSTRKAPAIATVITADEIKNMGARNLMDVLKMVPGFGVSMNEWKYMIEVRGVRTSISEKILLMTDGHRMNHPYAGSGFDRTFEDLPVENVKQIEIVRGPGSALYGANAFVAVVNIITKEADDVNGIEATVGGGSFDTKKINLTGGKSFDDFKVFGTLDYLKTEGPELTVEADRISSTSFSAAPGDTDLSLEKTDFFLKASYGDLIFRGHFLNKRRGAYIGVNYALTDENSLHYKNFWTDLSYRKNITDKLSVSLRGYYDNYDDKLWIELFPEGFSGYSDGMIGAPYLKERILGTELQIDTDLFEGNHLISGFNFENTEQYDVTLIANYDPWTGKPLDSIQDVSSWGNYNKNVTREVWAVYIQDEWSIRENLSLTAGVRYDHYDDFGGTTNPRAGFVWNFTENAEMKLLYGQAFRAPNFVELYNDGNPVAVGNPALEPEEIKTYEVALGYRFGTSHTINMNYFYNDIDSMIVRDYSISPATYRNLGGAEIEGIEVVLRGQYSPVNYWKLSYTWQNPEDADTGEELPNVPSHRAAFSLNWGITKYLNAHTDILWTGERTRPAGDPREDMPDYTTVDVSLIAKNFYKGFEIQASVHNLFDEEYEDPDTSGANQYIPYDYPREGISALIELSYKF